jgi:hypothetical protein
LHNRAELVRYAIEHGIDSSSEEEESTPPTR